MADKNKELQAKGRSDDEVDSSGEETETTIWDYLETERGHSIAEKVVTIFADLKNSATETLSNERKAKLDAEIRLRKFEHGVQVSVFILAILVAGTLSYFDKFGPGISMLIGSLVGFFFGRRNPE